MEEGTNSGGLWLMCLIKNHFILHLSFNYDYRLLEMDLKMLQLARSGYQTSWTRIWGSETTNLLGLLEKCISPQYVGELLTPK